MRLTVRIAAAVFLCSIFLPPSGMAAGWVDDWIAQKTTTAPDYFSGQKRGYFSGGSFSARWPNSNDYPVTFEPPRLKGGCGGIDAFLGGFSFLDFEYLVDKLQRILMSGGAVAFDLALNTMCQPCSNTIKGFEAIADKLNNLQIDDCAASKKLVATITSGDFASTDAARSTLGNAIKSTDQALGVEDLYHAVSERFAANNNVAQQTAVTRTVSGCSAEIKAVLLGNLDTSGTSLLDNVGVAKMGLSQDYIDMIRGLVGDIRVEGPDDGLLVTSVAPCPQNDGKEVKAFIKGDVFKKTAAGACLKITDANADLLKYINDSMSDVANKIRTQTTLSASEEAFIKNSPLSIGLVLKTAVGTEQEASTIANLSEFTAKAYSLQMLADLYNRAMVISQRAEQLASESTSAAPGQAAESCNADTFAQGIAEKAAKMTDMLFALQREAKSSYQVAADELAVVLNIVDDMRRAEDLLQSQVSRRFGPGVTARLFSTF